MAIYPGATFKPTSWGGKVARNKQGRGILHVAVSERVSYPPNSANTWHFYIAKAAPNGATDGSGGPAYCEQYVDTEYRAYGAVEANDDAIIIETAGGLGASAQINSEPWTRAQELRIADIMRWESQQPDGAPLELLPDAKPGRRGWGPHRLGIKHSQGLVPGWWFPGCEVWSSSLGKECPGTAKVNQIPGIMQIARSGGDDMYDENARKELLKELGEIRRLAGLVVGWGGAVPSEAAKLALLWGSAQVDVDEEALAAQLAPLLTARLDSLSDADIERISTAVAEEQARRLGSS